MTLTPGQVIHGQERRVFVAQLSLGTRVSATLSSGDLTFTNRPADTAFFELEGADSSAITQNWDTGTIKGHGDGFGPQAKKTEVTASTTITVPLAKDSATSATGYTDAQALLFEALQSTTMEIYLEVRTVIATSSSPAGSVTEIEAANCIITQVGAEDPANAISTRAFDFTVQGELIRGQAILTSTGAIAT